MVGASLPLVAALVAGTLAGALMGETVGAGVPLDFAITLVFVALLAPQIERRATALAAVGAGAVAVAGAGLPVNLGLLVAVLCGTVVGVVAETRLSGGTR
jgi:predicted branched-subunit amino acid permease